MLQSFLPKKKKKKKDNTVRKRSFIELALYFFHYQKRVKRDKCLKLVKAWKKECIMMAKIPFQSQLQCLSKRCTDANNDGYLGLELVKAIKL